MATVSTERSPSVSNKSADDSDYSKDLLQQVLEAQIEERNERDSDYKLTHRWWLQYLAGLIGVSTLGASITFGVLTTSDNKSGVKTSSNQTSGLSSEPGAQASNETYSSPRFNEGTVRVFLAVTFLLFLLVIGFSNLILFLLIFYEKKYFTKVGFWKVVDCKILRKPRFNRLLHLCNLIITSLMLAAFIMLALVVVAYAEEVGWITLCFIFVYWFIYACIWYTKLERGDGSTPLHIAARSGN